MRKIKSESVQKFTRKSLKKNYISDDADDVERIND